MASPRLWLTSAVLRLRVTCVVHTLRGFRLNVVLPGLRQEDERRSGTGNDDTIRAYSGRSRRHRKSAGSRECFRRSFAWAAAVGRDSSGVSGLAWFAAAWIGHTLCFSLTSFRGFVAKKYTPIQQQGFMEIWNFSDTLLPPPECRMQMRTMDQQSYRRQMLKPKTSQASS